MVFKEILKWLQIYWIPHEKHSFFFFFLTVNMWSQVLETKFFRAKPNLKNKRPIQVFNTRLATEDYQPKSIVRLSPNCSLYGKTVTQRNFNHKNQNRSKWQPTKPVCALRQSFLYSLLFNCLFRAWLYINKEYLMVEAASTDKSKRKSS